MFFILVYTFFTTLKRGKIQTLWRPCELPKPENPGAENAFHSITEKPVWNPENAGGVLDFLFTNFTSGKAIWTCTWKGNLWFALKRQFVIVHEKTIWTCTWKGNLYFALKRQFVLVHEKTICVCTWKVICTLHLKNF